MQRGHVPPQRRCRLGSVPPLGSLLRPVPRALLLSRFLGALCVSWGSVAVEELGCHVPLVLRAPGLGRGGRGGPGGDGGVGGRAVLLPVFEPEGVAAGRRGGGRLGRLRQGALGRVLGHLRQGHVVQFGGHLGPPEGSNVEDGLPLLDLLVDGELGAVRDGRPHKHFGPGASAGLGWGALRPLWGALGRAAVRGHGGEGQGPGVEVLPPVAEVRVGLLGAVGGGEGAGVEGGVGERLGGAAAGQGLVLGGLIPSVAVADVSLGGAVVLGVPAVPVVELAGLEAGNLLRVPQTFKQTLARTTLREELLRRGVKQ